MAKQKKKWTAELYKANAEDFVACYGKDYCWAEFVDEYCALWDEDPNTSDYVRPNADDLYDAIMAARKNAL